MRMIKNVGGAIVKARYNYFGSSHPYEFLIIMPSGFRIYDATSMPTMRGHCGAWDYALDALHDVANERFINRILKHRRASNLFDYHSVDTIDIQSWASRFRWYSGKNMSPKLRRLQRQFIFEREIKEFNKSSCENISRKNRIGCFRKAITIEGLNI